MNNDLSTHSPPQTPATVLDRAIDMLRGASTVNDLTAEIVSHHLGVPVERDSANEYGYGQSLPWGDWGLARWETSDHWVWLEIRIDRTETSSGYDDLTYQQFAETMQSLGLVAHTDQDRYGRITHHRFERGELRVQVFPFIATTAQSDEPSLRVHRILVS